MNPDPSLLQSLLSLKAPRAARLAAAKGLLPLPTADLVLVLIRLTADPDQVINAEANSTLAGIEDSRLEPILKEERTSVEILKYFSFDPTREARIREWTVMNSSTPDETIADLAAVSDSPLLELILMNQVRLLRFPLILENLEQNPEASPDVRRRSREVREEFFLKPAQREAALRAEASAPVAAAASSSASAESLPAPTIPIEVEVPLRPEDLGLSNPREVSTFQRLSRLNTAERVKIALLGTREERSILVRDTNREVAKAVVKSPKITDQEIESISQMRNISDEILRIIGNHRDWLKSYTVIRNLVRNPKTPIAISLKLLPRILESDLRMMARDKSIPETVRRNAQRSLTGKGSTY